MKKSLLILVLIPFLLLSCDTDPKPPEYTGPGTLEITLTGELAGDYELCIFVGPEDIKGEVQSSPAVWETENAKYTMPWISVFAFKKGEDFDPHLGEENIGKGYTLIFLDYESGKRNQYSLEMAEIEVEISFTDDGNLLSNQNVKARCGLSCHSSVSIAADLDEHNNVSFTAPLLLHSSPSEVNIDAKLYFEDDGHEYIVDFFKAELEKIPVSKKIEQEFEFTGPFPTWLDADKRIYIKDIWNREDYDDFGVDEENYGKYGFAANPDPDGGFVFLIPVYEGSDAIDSPDFPWTFFEEELDKDIEEVMKAREIQTKEWKALVKELVDYIEAQEDKDREVFGKDLIWP